MVYNYRRYKARFSENEYLYTTGFPDNLEDCVRWHECVTYGDRPNIFQSNSYNWPNSYNNRMLADVPDLFRV